ncbi:Endolytic murein transglycosylase [Andreprevotia sp. IGB-42]|uniref:endolytic transglycosylase MltG n=1 Tax=Andreprevotia sp. IGB-42 TaxID=2497473 RepID=UPI001359C179|nr:endolytic transglycosylase MltG [Andreprevotia sp. IGB-42]KAF0815473.1 Endolytic murein transglycosylase [Andreprevotia sp. IGB-42]
MAAPRRKPTPKNKKSGLGWFGRLLVLAVLLAGAAAGYVGWYAYQPIALQDGATPLRFTLGPGSVKRSAEQLYRQGVIDSPALFLLLTKATGNERQIKAGVYQLDKPLTPLELIAKLARGDAVQLAFTLIEGWNWRDLKQALALQPELKHDIAGLSDAQIAQKLGIAAGHPEGQFFPDTYFIDLGSSDLKLLARAHARLQEKLDAAWAQRSPGIPVKTPYEALILASIIEKETGLDSDRAMVGSVFTNRLKIGMRLQTDPSVIYGLGADFDGNLTRTHLQTDTPYNSYTRAGLPPTPIAMPGNAALLAATQPAQSKALYFVARGDGSSAFSETLDAHNAAVQRFQRGAR